MIYKQVENRYRVIQVTNGSRICFGMMAMMILAGCSNDKLGTDKIEAQDAKGPIPPLVMPPGMQKPKAVLAPTDIKQASDANLTGLGIPLYPGAEPSSSANDAIAANKSYGVTLGVFETRDSIDKVVAFYRMQFPISGKLDLASASHAEWMDEKVGGKRTVHINITDPSKGDGLKTVEISHEKDKTSITLMRVANAKLSGFIANGKSSANMNITPSPSPSSRFSPTIQPPPRKSLP